MHSLRSKSEFQSVFRKGSKTENDFFRAWSATNRFKESRWAFVVPKTVDKRSVVRNRLRRRIRERVRQKTNLQAKQKDVLFFLKKSAAGLPRKQFYEELDKTLQNIFG